MSQITTHAPYERWARTRPNPPATWSAVGLEKETGIGHTPIRESFVHLREQENWEPILDQHREMLHAIMNGDTDEASYLAASHLHPMPEEQGPAIALHPDYFKTDNEE